MKDRPLNEINKAYYPLIARITFVAIALDVLFYVLFVVFNSDKNQIWIWIIFYAVKEIIFVYLAALAAYRWTKTYYDIEPESGLIKRYSGIHFPTETSYSLQNLHSVSYKQSILGKILKYGDLSLTFTNREGNKEELIIMEVVDPEKYKSFFDKYLMK